jgi:hypothetical protein
LTTTSLLADVGTELREGYAEIGGHDDAASPNAYPESQWIMAGRASSTTEEVKPSHASMVSHPNAVTKLEEAAARATA